MQTRKKAYFFQIENKNYKIIMFLMYSKRNGKKQDTQEYINTHTHTHTQNKMNRKQIAVSSEHTHTQPIK